jgi:hypothetical protein
MGGNVRQIGKASPPERGWRFTGAEKRRGASFPLIYAPLQRDTIWISE